MEALGVGGKEPRHWRDGIRGDRRAAALRLDVGEDRHHEQALFRRVEEMPEVPAVLVPTGAVRFCARIGRRPRRRHGSAGVVGRDIPADAQIRHCRIAPGHLGAVVGQPFGATDDVHDGLEGGRRIRAQEELAPAAGGARVAGNPVAPFEPASPAVGLAAPRAVLLFKFAPCLFAHGIGKRLVEGLGDDHEAVLDEVPRLFPAQDAAPRRRALEICREARRRLGRVLARALRVRKRARRGSGWFSHRRLDPPAKR